MSRTNPFKRKKRFAKYTTLVYCEGISDEKFIKLLKELFEKYDSNISFKVQKGKGGSADQIVIDASRFLGDFNKRRVVLDNDKPKEEMEKAFLIAKDNNIIILPNNPCLEAVLLSILEDGINHRNKSSKLCKKEFERKYIPKNKRGGIVEYRKTFPIEMLKKQRLKIDELDKLLFLIEECVD